jgi:hypothetical protein
LVPATISAYFYDPTGAKARAVTARHVGVCRGCGAYTQPRNGKGDAYAYCKACHPGAIARRLTRERVLAAMLDWRTRYGQLPTSYDWSRERGGDTLERLTRGQWPAASVVARRFGSWAVARATARKRDEEEPVGPRAATTSSLGSKSASLPKPRESTAISEDLRGGATGLQQYDLQGFSVCGSDFAHDSGR